MTMNEALDYLRTPDARLALSCPYVAGFEPKFWTALRSVALNAINERDAMHGESEIVIKAQNLMSDWQWEMGELITAWLVRYARGRPIEDFAILSGANTTQVRECWAVCREFHDVRGEYPHLRWSHFKAAVGWDDARECLSWANETKSTVAEMRAWRRAQRGEDLSIDEEP